MGLKEDSGRGGNVSSDLGQEPLVGCCEHANEYSRFIKAKNFCCCDCEFPNLHSATWNLDS